MSGVFKQRPAVNVVTDGAFSQATRIGGWSFYVPLYAYHASGSSEGMDSGEFELMAAVKALEWILEHHGSPDPIRVQTDCATVIHWVREADMRVRGTSARQRIATNYEPYIQKLIDISKRRPLTASKVSEISNPYLKRCDAMAATALTAHLKQTPGNEPVIVSELARLLIARDSLRVKMARLEERIRRDETLIRAYQGRKIQRWLSDLLLSWSIKLNRVEASGELYKSFDETARAEGS